MKSLHLVWAIFLPLLSFGQGQYRFQHFTIKNGLSQNTVNCVWKDKEGCYWFGTQDGLNRFDGYSTKVFRHLKEDSTTISDNFILSIAEDRSGGIWVGTRNGINYFDKSTNRFRRIIVNEGEKNEFHNNIWSVFIDSGQNIFFSNAHLQLVKISKEDRKMAGRHCEVIANNARLLRTSENIYCLNEDEQITVYDKNNKQIWSLSDFRAKDADIVYPLDANKYLLATSGKLLLKSDDQLMPLPAFDGKEISSIYRDRKKNIWIGTSAGLYIVTGEDFSKPLILKTDPDDPSSISGNNIQSIYEDRDGLIWVGTAEGGVNIYDTRNIFFIFNHQTAIPISSNAVWGICQDKNELWVGTDNGLNHFVLDNDTILQLFSGKNKIISSELFFHNARSSNSVCSNFITCITRDKAGNMWFGSHESGISVYNTLSQKWRYYNTKNTLLRSDIIYNLLCATDGKIWIGSQKGFYFFDPATDSFKAFLPSFRRDSGYCAGYIMAIYEDRQKTIWVSSTDGIYHLAENGTPIACYYSYPNDSKGLSYGIVTSCLEDDSGAFWVTTLGGGLNLLDRQKGTFLSYTKKDGLANNVVYNLLENGNKNLWLTTNSGISVFDKKKKTFETLSEKDGLPSNEFTQNAVFKNSAGEFLFGSPEGLTVVNPEYLNYEKKQLPVFISSLKINYSDVVYRPGNPVTLYYGDKAVTFEFAATDFRAQEKINYAFTMDGFDNEWHDAPVSKRAATYTNLPFGKYTFKVRARKENGPWQENLFSIPVNVIPPFWLKPWFIAAEILSAIGMIVLLVRFYAQRKLKRRLLAAEVVQKVHEERERISRDLHDNVGSHLTYIISSLDNMAYKKQRGEASADEIADLSDFSRDTMQQLRDSIWAINKTSISLSELRDKISEYANKMTSVANMHFSIRYEANGEVILTPSLTINIYRIVQEAVHNAVKHSAARSIAVVISQNESHSLCITVEDDGKGIKDEGSGFGLKNMKDRVNELKGEMFIDSSNNGTRIKFSIPA